MCSGETHVTLLFADRVLVIWHDLTIRLIWRKHADSFREAAVQPLTRRLLTVRIVQKTKAILECTPPDGEDGESQEDEAELPEDRRKTLVTGINLSNLSMPQMQDDDPYEDEEEEEQESDELVVEEDKPYISHKQAQSVRLLGSLEKIERRVCSAPGAPHLTLPRAPSQSGRPKTSPFPPTKRPESKDSKSGRAKSIRATAYYSRPTTVGGSDAETRPATVESRRTTPLSRTASPAKPDWVWALRESVEVVWRVCTSPNSVMERTKWEIDLYMVDYLLTCADQFVTTSKLLVYTEDTSFYSMHQRRIPTYAALAESWN